MVITILAENTASPESPDLAASHGLSIHAATPEWRILYDFGPDGDAEKNAAALGLPMDDVDWAVLSHGHSDHSGGLGAFLEGNGKAGVYHGIGAFERRWSIKGGAPEEIGVDPAVRGSHGNRLVAVEGKTELDGIGVLLPAAPGEYPRPRGNATLLRGPEGDRLPDEFDDEVTLAAKGEDGLVVFTGCSHRGILNILGQVRAYCPDCDIKAVIGGFHLRDRDETEESLESVARALAEISGGATFYSGHCTEGKAARVLGGILGPRFRRLRVGMRFSP